MEMSRITVSFDPEWLGTQRQNGVRVIRRIEKWLASEEDVSLKSSSGTALTVELKPAGREKFLADLAELLKEDFGESDPWTHAVFSGDLAGLDVPTLKDREEEYEYEDEDGTEDEDEDGEVDEELARALDEWLTEAGEADEEKEQETPPPPEQKVQQSEESRQGKGLGIDSPPQPDPLKVLEEICSRVPIKYSRELEAYVRETAAVIPTLQRMGVESSLWHQHLLLAVDEGYGRSEFLAALAKLYNAFGLMKGALDKSSVREYILLPDGDQNSDGYRLTWNRLLDVVESMSRSNVRNGISKVVLYIDVSAWQSSLESPELKAYLRRLNSLCGTFLVVFRVPFLEGHVLRETADALNDILNVRTIAVPPVPLSDMIDYARSELASSGFRIADDAMGAFEQWVLHEKVDNSFFGYKTMDKVVQKVIFEKALTNCRRKVEDRVIGLGDLEVFGAEPEEDDPAEELARMIGMREVERRLNEVIVQIKTQRALAAKGKKVERPVIHMLFTGSPGTGKTTVARIAARMMRQAGILRKGHLVEVRGRDLCGEYIGTTAPKTSAICRDAYGSVLFIDEAYSLFRSDFASSRDFGREALDTLVAEMENHRDDFCVIMAGYKDEMDAMLLGNTGLKSRIPYEIEFPNYTREDLEKIFFTMLDGNFDYEENLKEAVHEFFAAMPEETFTSKVFSNARLVRNLYERTWGKAAYRQSLEGGGDLRILKSDLAGAMSDNEFKKLMKKSAERRTIGFGA